MKTSYLLDSWAIMAYFKREQPADQQILALLEAAQQNRIQLSLSVINLGEVFYNIGRARGEQFAEYILREMRQLPLEIVPVDETLVLSAARWKMKYPVSYADAFAAATAERLRAILVTGDPELMTLKDVLPIEPLERSQRQ